MSCKICYENKNEVITKCGHEFCMDCLKDWIEIEQICPYCRSDINFDTILDSYRNHISKIILRSQIYKLKKTYLLYKIKSYLKKVEDYISHEEQIKTYEELNKFLYKNIYYLKYLDKNNNNTRSFIKVLISRTLYISKDYTPAYYWHVKFRDYFLIK